MTHGATGVHGRPQTAASRVAHTAGRGGVSWHRREAQGLGPSGDVFAVGIEPLLRRPCAAPDANPCGWINERSGMGQVRTDRAAAAAGSGQCRGAGPTDDRLRPLAHSGGVRGSVPDRVVVG